MPPLSSRTRRARGMSLIAAMIVVGVLTLLVAAAIVFTGQERQGATQHMRRETLAACAQAARNYVLSQLRAGPSANNSTIRGVVDTGEFLMRTGHIDEAGGPTDVTTAGPAIQPDSDSPGTGSMRTWGHSNRVDSGGSAFRDSLAGGGMAQVRLYRVVANCLDKQTRGRTEIEFQMRLAF